MAKPQLQTSDDLLICTACGTQFDVTASSGKNECRICDDPRQFVPPTGQTFTTLAEMKKNGYRNVWKQDEADSRIWSVWTEQKFAIGERAILLQTPNGNVLWDLITFLDEETVEKIHSLGGLTAIVISHPHFYTTYASWAATFSCPVYTSAHDAPWLSLNLDHPHNHHRFLHGPIDPIIPDVTAITCGGHFPGSLVLHWDKKLFIADTMLTVPSGRNPELKTPKETVTYSFLWSIPNWIPLAPDEVFAIWKAIRGFEWEATYGAFVGMDVRDQGGEVNGEGRRCKERVLESMKIVVRAMGWREHALLVEKV